jgi:hypothetical protein
MHLRRLDLTSYGELAANHWIDKLDAVVFGNIVGGRNHDTDGLALELLRSERRQEAHTENDGVEKVAGIAISNENPAMERD